MLATMPWWAGILAVWWWEDRRRRRHLELLAYAHRTRIAALAGPWRREDPDFPGCTY
ncbi:MAG TPA: hypothetical protein VFP65_11255 [Anaeromyxobacteraceae bacterium]|nr:hypothetical protein [Anaeromyxobacteraceae bacterium]